MLVPLLDLIYAPICLACRGAILPGDAVRLICRRCRSRIRPLPDPACPRCGGPLLRTGRLPEPNCGECREWPPYLRSARSAALLHPPADLLVHHLKYRGWHALAEPLGTLMSRLRLPPDVEAEARIVVPVPTTGKRLRERGYNQAERLAAVYARETGRELAPALMRMGAGSTQTALQPAARGANVAGTFRVVEGAAPLIEGEHLLIIDDVLTTGATAIECARTLVEAGARCVSLITFARALDVRRLTTN